MAEQQQVRLQQQEQFGARIQSEPMPAVKPGTRGDADRGMVRSRRHLRCADQMMPALAKCLRIIRWPNHPPISAHTRMAAMANQNEPVFTWANTPSI